MPLGIRLREIQSGDLLNVIVINGFLSEKNSYIADWLSVIEGNFQSPTVQHYDWEACCGSTFFNEFSIGGYDFDHPDDVLMDLVFSNKLAATAVKSLLVTANVGYKQWRKAMKNAELAGKKLAKHIDKQDECFTLMGHSLGASVIYHCLENLQSTNKVTNAFLLGGAAGKELPWNELLHKHSQMNIFNCYSDNDLVLKTLYAVGTSQSDPIGLNPIEQRYPERLHNIDMSIVVSGHMQYKTSNVGKFLKFRNDENVSFARASIYRSW